MKEIDLIIRNSNIMLSELHKLSKLIWQNKKMLRINGTPGKYDQKCL